MQNADRPEAPTVVELLRSHARRDPDRDALVSWDGGRRNALSYASLDETTDRVAAGLAAAGLGPGDRLGIVVDNADASVFYRLLYGAYKARVVPVPVNTRLAPPEIAHIIRDSGARMLVGAEVTLEAVRGEDVGEATLRSLEIVSELESSDGPVPHPASADDVADLLYTSGTTGLPKGSVFRHRALAHNAQSLGVALRLEASDIFQTPAPVYTSTGTHTFPLPILFAGCTFVVEPGFDVVESAERLADEGTTVFFGVPAMLMLLLEHLPSEQPLPRLKSLMYGGSPMPPAVVPRLLDRFEGAGLWNLYGLTEGGPTGCVLPPEEAMRRPGSVGLPVPGTELRIVDEAGRDVGPGVPGEILLRSETLMEGYHNAPEATRSTLVDGWLHTGDIGARDRHGFVSVLDRKKDMIVRGGFNVYPAEVEKVLHEHPDVLEVAVVGIPHAILGEDVCAVVALRPGTDAGIAQLRAFCGERLADFKRPRRWELVDELPRNAMGKILKRELRDNVAEGASPNES